MNVIGWDHAMRNKVCLSLEDNVIISSGRKCVSALWRAKLETRRHKIMGRFKAKLEVNKRSTEMNAFVEELLARTLLGIVASLKGPGDVQTLELQQERGNVEITVNGRNVPLTPFPNDIICSTLTGLVSSLKGVDDIESMVIRIDLQ